MLTRNDRKFCDRSALYVTCFKTDLTRTYFCPPIRFFAPQVCWKVFQLFGSRLIVKVGLWVKKYGTFPPKKMLPEIGDHFVTPGNIQMGEGYGKNSKLSGAC